MSRRHSPGSARLGHWGALVVAVFASPGAAAAQRTMAAFADYRTPLSCVVATWRVTRMTLVRRPESSIDPANHDSLESAIHLDTLTPAGVATARRCGDRFQVADVPRRQLHDLFDLAALMADTARMNAAVQRRVGWAESAEDTARALVDAIGWYRTTRPRPPARLMEGLERQLDRMGRAALMEGVTIHALLLADAVAQFDTAGMVNEAKALVTGYGTLSTAAKRQWNQRWKDDRIAGGLDALWTDPLFQAHTALGDVEALRQPYMVGAWLRRSGALVPVVRAPNGVVMFAARRGGNAWFSAFGYDSAGVKAPPLHADYWLGADSATHGQRPGAVRYYLRVGSAHEMGGEIADVRRLMAKYGDQGLSTILILESSFYVADSTGPHLALGGQQVEAARKWYLETLHLPVTLAVVVPQFERDSDGVLHALPDGVSDRSWGIVDRQGRTLPAPGEPRLEAWIRRALTGGP